MNKIRINQGRVLMWQFRVAGTLLVFFIGAAAFLNLEETYAILVFIAASFLLPVLWSSYTVFEINPAEKIISEYYWVAGFKLKEKAVGFSAIEKIYINEVQMIQNYQNFFGSERSIKSLEYQGFLKLADGNKHYIASSSRPEKLKEKLVPLAKKLNCDLVENF